MSTYYRAIGGNDQRNRDIFAGSLGGWQGRLLIEPSKKYKTIANANSLGKLNEADIDKSIFGNDDQIATVSGLTFCIGVIIARRVTPHMLGSVAVAHFNGGYDHVESWKKIANELGVGGSSFHSVVIATRDTTATQMHSESDDCIIKKFGGHLSAYPFQVPDENQIYYLSTGSGVEFGITRQGVIGEPEPTLHEK